VSATNFVEGPDLILFPTRRAEEAVVLFHAVLRATVSDLATGGNVGQRLLQRASQEALVRDALRVRASQNEVELLVALVGEQLGVDPDTIDVKRPLFETSCLSRR
jgi:hypothetical protein